MQKLFVTVYKPARGKSVKSYFEDNKKKGAILWAVRNRISTVEKCVRVILVTVC